MSIVVCVTYNNYFACPFHSIIKSLIFNLLKDVDVQVFSGKGKS